jgi:hypothetical protein
MIDGNFATQSFHNLPALITPMCSGGVVFLKFYQSGGDQLSP